MDKFLTWCRTYNTEITWFIIGLMVTNAIVHLAQGQLGMAAVDIIIAGVNFFFWRADR